jgi:CBS domain-containing protein
MTRALDPTSVGHAPRTVGDVMRPPATTVETRAHAAAAAYLMKRSHDSALVVVSNDSIRSPLGIITDADVSQAVADGQDLEQLRVSDLIKGREPVTVGPDTSVDAALRLMLDTAHHHLVVVQDAGCVGVVDMSDLCRALLTDAERGAPPPSPTAVLRGGQ